MKTVRLNEEAVKAVFESSADQGDALVAIYKMAFGPDWDRITKLDGWPACNQSTWKTICRLFMDFDQKHHPQFLAGGAWMNSGFSSHDAEDLKDWQVRLCAYQIGEEQSHAA